jgi:thioredoxin reductase
MRACDVAIIGAGPYGLSIAAHLKKAGVDFRIFGKPMDLWVHHMPKGMFLKSEGFASSLYDPGKTFSLEVYCKLRGLPYQKIGSPVPLKTFAEYGLEFQRRFVPELEQGFVKSVRRECNHFRVSLESGEDFSAQRVVVAVGLTYYARLPKELKDLPTDLVTHSYNHTTVDCFNGKEVGVLGAGASALDLAALLHQAGANVHVIARGLTIRFHDPPSGKPPSLYQRIRRPFTEIGSGWKLWLCANLPLVFRLMPEDFRIDRVRRALGPAPGWFTKEQTVGKVKFHMNASVIGAEKDGDKLNLLLRNGVEHEQVLRLDHLIAATGYRADVRRLQFLGEEIISDLKLVDASPALSSNFESTVPNLFFVGVTAANTFGPLVRFAVGAGFAAPRLAIHLQRTVPRGFSTRTVRESARNSSTTETVSQ